MDDATWELANGAKVPSFNTREFYLDVGSAFLSSLAHKTSSAAPSSLGEVADWKIIGVQAADFSLKAVAEGTTPTPPTANPVGKAEYNADGSKLTVLVYDTTTKDAAGAESKLYIDGSAVTGGIFTLGTSGGPSSYVLSGTAGDYTSSTVVGWETNSVSGFASALKAEYISHSDWNDYALGVTAKANLDVYLSSYIVNTHKEGDPLTKLNTFTQDISESLKPLEARMNLYSSLTRFFDLAGNTGFRDGSPR